MGAMAAPPCFLTLVMNTDGSAGQAALSTLGSCDAGPEPGLVLPRANGMGFSSAWHANQA